ncbi:MAG: hypothetical protein K0R77_179 [Chryseobacterium sp.]|jgi:hypothetical protein|uniref:hypothetical protein n=1 Tax=Chryseobacterium sp. TaxID=1871047 RepID=UPI002634A4EB|nr:hypothetical protein [Chryseobacterium sp.]MDF2550904.1 hypothetical protein [Chryseobacterium sp.]
MKKHFIDKVNVIIDGSTQKVVTISGLGYDINIVKNKAIELVKVEYPNSKLAAVIFEHKEVNIEEYKSIIGSNPPWLGNLEK